MLKKKKLQKVHGCDHPLTWMSIEHNFVLLEKTHDDIGMEISAYQK